MTSPDTNSTPPTIPVEVETLKRVRGLVVRSEGTLNAAQCDITCAGRWDWFKEAANELRQAQADLDAILARGGEGIVQLSADQRLEVVNIIAQTIWPEAEWDGEQENANIAAIKVFHALIRRFTLTRIEAPSPTPQEPEGKD